jgi:hypothetical protein
VLVVVATSEGPSAAAAAAQLAGARLSQLVQVLVLVPAIAGTGTSTTGTVAHTIGKLPCTQDNASFLVLIFCSMLSKSCLVAAAE